MYVYVQYAVQDYVKQTGSFFDFVLTDRRELMESAPVLAPAGAGQSSDAQGLRDRGLNRGGRPETVGPKTSTHTECLGSERVEFNAGRRLMPLN